MLTLLFTGLVLTASQVPTVTPKAVAMVVTWSGSPTWSDGKTTRPLRTYDRLRPGETVAAGPKGAVTVYFPEDGHKEVLHAGASIVVGQNKGTATGKVDIIESKLKIENKDALREAITAGKIGGTVHRDSRVLDPVIVPVNDAIIVTDQPTLRWPAVKDATAYRVTLQTAGSGKTVWTREIAGTELKFPADAKALARSLKYTWSVTAIFPNKNEKLHLKERSFIVGAASMAKQAEEWKTLAESADPTDQMLAAVGYEHLGLLDELYPLYAKITKTVTNDAKLWAIQSTYAAKAGLEQESDDAWKKATQLGWKDEP